MRITLLGTGSADGWPNPFCRCASCSTERTAGRARTPSSALVDDVLLIDAGPTTPHLPPGGPALDHVEHLLLTHGHPDHLHPALLLTRHWTSPRAVLHVWGPPAALDLCRDWIAPDAPVDLHPLIAGDEMALDTAGGTYSVQALPARHDHGNGDVLAAEALLFDVTGPDGGRLLYATDTGPFTAEEIGLATDPYDVVVLDETFGDTLDHGTGHLDLARLPALLADLRAHGCVTAATRVIATHLSHHNPPTPELRRRLAPLGVEVLADLASIDTADGTGSDRRGRRLLILGGARSGKSRHAEELAADATRVTYVATGGQRPDDGEWTERVRRHRERRPARWTTVESSDVSAVLAGTQPGETVLVDCLALWLTAALDDIDAWSRSEAGGRSAVEDEAHERITALVAAIERCPSELILVSNEVGMGVVPATSSGRLFQDLLGSLNARVAEQVDEAVIVIAGQLLPLTARATSTRSSRD